MPGTTSPLRGSSQTLPGRATSTSGTDLSPTSTLTQTTTLAGTSRSGPQAEVAKGPGACCRMGGVGRGPCTAPDEGLHRAEDGLPSPF